MSSSLAYSEIDTNNKDGLPQIKGTQKRVNNNCTRRRPQINKPNNQNVTDMLKLISDTNGYESFQDTTEESELENFNPPPKPVLNSINEGNQNNQNVKNNVNIDEEETPIKITEQTTDKIPVDTTQQVVQNRVYPQPLDSFEGYKDMPKNYSKDFYKNYVPYFNQDGYTNLTSNSNNNKDQLLDKLNYMIHLLEEQKDEKTGHVIEEVILYSFLGIFIIFIVDSFARAGKYTR